jgi:archaellum component FlaF (FlaF/FlaG flagellin family)
VKKLVFYIFLLFVAFASCKDDEITTDPQYRLVYSADTISFDTILGGLTTPYQTLKVYNKSGEKIKISSINYASSNDYFMVNINGRNSHNVTNVEIADGDSMFIFVQTNGDISGSEIPFALLDSISFSYNGNVDYVYLSAFSETPIILDHFVVTSDTTLSGSQPYFVKDTLKVEEGATLNIDAGVRLYFYNGASLYVDGSLNCNGEVDNQIEMRYFRGDNLFKDTKYYLAPGNWKGVWLSQKSRDCKIMSTNIVGAYQCLVVDSAFVDRKVIVGNSQIYNAKQGTLVSEASQIYAYNTLFANGGYYNVYLTDGKYLFNHCTIASYLNFNLSDTKPALYLNKKDSISVDINNSIVCGNNKISKDGKRIDLDNVAHNLNDSIDGKNFRLNIVCSAISRTDSLTGGNNYGNIWDFDAKINTENKFFIEFKTDSLSPYRTLGSDAILKLYPECATDIFGKNRVDDELPDAGAYEY